MTSHKHQMAEMSLTGDRKRNQDRCSIAESNESVLLTVADGMGGHPRGEAAAQIVTETCSSYFQRTPHPILSPGSFLTRIMQKAHEDIVAFGYENDPPIDPRTTAVIALIQDSMAYWAHAGDSRLYIFRKGRLVTRTTDHSYVERLRQQGVISSSELESHPQRNYVTRCLGGTLSLPEVELGKHSVEPGDILLLCSDGLWGSIDKDLMCEALFGDMSLADATQALANEAAQRAFPDSDNVTLLTMRVGESAKPVVTSAPPKARPAKKKDELGEAIANLQDAINSFESEVKDE
ncbi:MAG: protein phosphatase 2C domain-containing protein [Candidatus Sedimenticola sp. 20ELBAFRAG]